MTESEVYMLLNEVGEGRGLSPTLVAQIETLYVELFGKKIGRPKCKNRIPDAIIEIRLRLRHQKLQKMKYILKRGIVIHFADTGEFYTRTNMTDAVAVKWLRRYPNQIDKFEKFPENWEQEIAAPTRSKKKKTSKAKSE